MEERKKSEKQFRVTQQSAANVGKRSEIPALTHKVRFFYNNKTGSNESRERQHSQVSLHLFHTDANGVSEHLTLREHIEYMLSQQNHRNSSAIFN